MASEWTVVLRFEEGEEPSEEFLRDQLEEDWCCVVIEVTQEDI